MWAGVGGEPEGGVHDMQQQFEQQQSLIVQLKEMLRENEQQLVTKERQVEEYATKLSNIKSRAKASKASATRQVEAEAPVPPELAASGGGGWFEVQEVVGDETMEEAERKDAGQEQEEEEEDGEEKRKRRKKKLGKNADKARQGNLSLLRKKLEENRMMFEQRGREMSDSKRVEEKLEHLRVQLEERDLKIQELQRGLESSAQPRTPARDRSSEDMLHAATAMAAGDEANTRVLEMSSRIAELEASLLDLQENLKEKDAVIDARTRAITLMSDDMSRRSKNTLDTLEETRQQMRFMQQNFVALESQMKEEKEDLNRQLEAKSRRLLQLEEGNRKLESVRYDLSSRVAELQAKVVHLQTQNCELQKVGGGGGREEELTHALEDANKQMIKAKAQHKNRVKQLTKQLDSLRSVSEASGEILRLEQRVAELEEDKGNLQLHLVDFDELKASEEGWRQRVHELEDRVALQDRDLDYHIRALSLVEAEKLDLLQGTQEMRNQAVRLEELKVTAELKSVQLEEQLEAVCKEKVELQEKVAALGRDKAELQEELATLQTCSLLLPEVDASRSFQVIPSGKESEEAVSLQMLECRLEEASKAVAQQREVIEQLSSKVDLREKEIECHKEVICRLQERRAEEKEEELLRLAAQLKESTSDVIEWRSTCEHVQERVRVLEVENRVLEGKLEEAAEVNGGLDGKLREVLEVNSGLQREVEELSEVNGSLRRKLEEVSEVNGGLQRKLEDVSEVNGGLERKLEEVSEVNGSLERKLEEVLEVNGGLQRKLEEVSEVNGSLERKLEEVSEVNGGLQKKLEEVSEVNGSLERKLQQVSEVNGSLEMKLEEVSEVNYQLEKKVEELTEGNSKLERQLEGAMEANVALEKTMEEACSELRALTSQLEKETGSLRMELARRTEESSRAVMEMEASMRELQDALSATEERSAKLERRHLQSLSALEAKLQERDAVVESLEHELARSQARKQRLEEGLSDLEERRCSLEGKFEVLGEQLQQSDRSKREAEEHEGVLERRLSALVASEEILRGRLEGLRDNNRELVAETEELRRALASTESKAKIASVRADRLAPLEEMCAEASRKMEEMEEERRRVMAESDLRLKELHQVVESLEAELKNAEKQLQEAEGERRAVLERCEKLTDLKAMLEGELEEAEMALSRVQADAQQEKLAAVAGLEERVRELEEKLRAAVRDVTEADHLRTEASRLRAELEDRELQLQAYQARLLQLQFSGAGSRQPEAEAEAEEEQKESHLRSLSDLLSQANHEMEGLRAELKSSRHKIEELSRQTLCLHEEIRAKDRQLHSQMEYISVMAQPGTNAQYLEVERDHMHQQLAKETAKAEVLNAVVLAERHVNAVRSYLLRQRDATLRKVGGKQEQQRIGELEALVHRLKMEVNTLTEERDAALQKVVIQAEDGGGSGDEGWVWGSDEARLEEEHLRSRSQDMSTEEDLRRQASHLEKQVHVLEEEKQKLQEELKAAQVRRGKMVKKLQEVKAHNKNLEREQAAAKRWSSLDSTIKEELQICIDGLEKELREVKAEAEAAGSNRESLERRLEAAEAANERLFQARERLELESEEYRCKNRGLLNQIEALHWRMEELRGAGEGRQDMEEQLSALEADNEQLQRLLEEQKELRLAAEAALRELELRTSSNRQAGMVQGEGITDVHRAEIVTQRESYEAALQDLERSKNSPSSGMQVEVENAVLRQRLETEGGMSHPPAAYPESLEASYSYLQYSHNQLGMEVNALRETCCSLQAEYNKAQSDLRLQQEASEADRLHYKGRILQLEEEYGRVVGKLGAEKCTVSTMTVEEEKMMLEQQVTGLEEASSGPATDLPLELQQDAGSLRQQVSARDEEVKVLSEALSRKELEVERARVQLSDREEKVLELSRLLEDLRDMLDMRELEVQEAVQMLKTKESEEKRSGGSQAEDSELNLALYMLHQRDVRCDELTLELMQLLEERDTLQLRLSTALRINEELRVRSRQQQASAVAYPPAVPIRVPPSLAGGQQPPPPSGTELQEAALVEPIEPQPVTPSVPEGPREDLQQLASRLSQLHDMDYQRDVTVRDDRAHRYREQMQLLQRGSGVVVESNYTLLRDVQSPSTVLLNWIWGRSTPRVMHI